jgi:EmrB/QacA subfamily drug resistance transporter
MEKVMTGSVEPKMQIWVLVLTSTASLMIAVDVLVVATALDQIGREFGATVEALQWTINAYTLTFAVLLMTATVAADRFGRRRIFTLGLVVFALASAGCALATNIGSLIAARAVQGVGAAILMPLALAQLTIVYPPERRAWALGVYSSVTALSSVFGPVVGGAIAYGLAWQWIFWLNVPIGLSVAFLASYRLPETFGPPASADLPGLGLVTAAVLSLVLGLISGNDVGWANGQTVCFLAAGLICGAAFVGRERRCKEPMVPMSLFQITPFASGNIAMFLLNAAVMSSIFFMAQFLQVVLARNPLAAGLCLLPWGIALFVTAPKAAAVAQRFGAAVTVACGLALQGLGLAWLAAIATPGVSYGALVAPMIAAGAGFAIAIPVVQMKVVGAVEVSQVGKASGILSTIRQLGGAFGIAVTVAIFASFGSRANAGEFSRGFAAAVGAASLLSFGGAIAALWLSSMRSARLPEAPTTSLE